MPTQTFDIPAFGGKLDVSWNPESQVTPWGGLAYFVSYLKTSGLFDRLVEDAPFHYTSPNAPQVRDDEYKNQYGWGGFVTKDLKPCRAIARLIAIVANWWNIFCRLADGDRHLEPTTSRPMYMGIVGRLVVSGRKRLLRLTSTHLKATEIQSSLMRIGEFMKRISAIAEQLDFNRAWELIILTAFRKWLGGNRAKGLLPSPLTLID